MAASIPAWLPTAVQAGSTILSAIGQRKQARAYDQAGASARVAADYEAAQLEQNAGQQQAAAQRQAREQERDSRLAMSRALAVAAASGGGASDPTVMNIMARLAGEGTYRSMVSLYQGDEKSRQMRDQAAATRYSGQVREMDARSAAKAQRGGSVATLLSGASSLYSKYAKSDDPSAAKVESFAGGSDQWTGNSSFAWD